MTTIDEMLDSAAAGAVTIAPGWGQGRATYGGLVAGLLVARAEQLAEGRRLRSASVAFVAPVAPGEATLDGSVLRAGRSATQASVTLVQDGEPRAALLASFGDDRDSTITVDAGPRNPPPEIPAAETLEPIRFAPGALPEFFQHFELRFFGGAAGEPDFGGWMRFAVPPQRLGDRELVALADAWPPAISPMFDGPVAVSSLAWTFELVAWPPPGEQDAPDAHWQYDVRTLAAGDGYAQTRARIWDARGRLRALSGQTIAYFA